ncbi:KH domain-containing protein [Candidatus Woesearchaeota archaeon]|nr:KH domain-containing protein [Candidatus Woesearchaeota archaeon]
MAEYGYELRIPKDRIAVLIGKKGEIKKLVEEETKTKIKIDSKEGDVFISGEDALGLFNSREVIKAIGRGFNPEVAMLLLKGDYTLEIIDIKDFAGKNKNTTIRLKGRVIGESGKSRKTVEDLTECYISVYGKTIGLIGEPENVTVARRAVEDILKGSPHGNVYKWLEKRRRTMKRKTMMGVE